MILWLDDIRPIPKGFDTHAKTAKEAIQLLVTEDVHLISFDHDLGGGPSGYDVAKFIERRAFLGLAAPPRWDIHSANPVGRRNIQAAMESAVAHFKGNPEPPDTAEKQ